MNTLRKHLPRPLLAIVVLALGIRLLGVDFGLPYLEHPDEPLHADVTLNIVRTSDLRPTWYLYPSLSYYLNTAAFVPYYLIGKALGQFSSRADLLSPEYTLLAVGITRLPSAMLLSRLVSVVIGTFAAATAFFAARATDGQTRTGLLAALFVALSPTTVRLSRYITPDIFTVPFLLLALWGSFAILKHGRPHHYLLTGIACGLAAAAKYNAGLIVVVPSVAHVLRHGWRGVFQPYLFITAVASALTFAITSPFVLLDIRAALDDIGFVGSYYSLTQPGYAGSTLLWYLNYALRAEGVLIALALVAVVMGLIRRDKAIVLLAAFPIPYISFVSQFAIRNDRTLLPALPFLFILATYALTATLRHPRVTAVARPALIGALLLALVNPLALLTSETLYLLQPSPRVQAAQWAADHLPAGAHIAYESYAPYLDPTVYALTPVDGLHQHPPAWYIENGIDYLAFSSRWYARFLADPRYATAAANYQALFAAFTPAQTFTRTHHHLFWPPSTEEIRIYQVNPP